MNYEIGDKVKIIVDEGWPKDILDALRKNNNILTIKKISTHEKWPYIMKEVKETYYWRDNEIKCLISNYIEPEPINDRFEILDL